MLRFRPFLTFFNLINMLFLIIKIYNYTYFKCIIFAYQRWENYEYNAK